MLVGAFGNKLTATFTPPGGMTERSDAGVEDIALEGTDEAFVGPGATGTRVATSSASAINIGQLFALRGGAAPTPQHARSSRRMFMPGRGPGAKRFTRKRQNAYTPGPVDGPAPEYCYVMIID